MKRTEFQHRAMLVASISQSLTFCLTGFHRIEILAGAGVCLLLGVLLAKDYEEMVRRKIREQRNRKAVMAIERSRETIILNTMHLMDEWRKSQW